MAIEFSTFLTHVQSDCDRLAEAAWGHLELETPPCPGWTVGTVVDHLAQVYEHKIACTLTQREPDPWPPTWPERDSLEWLGDARRRLLSLLWDRGPTAPSHTWYPPDQTVGFWARRMAHETLIHRVDVELSRGPAGPVDPDLALDGVDEVLAIFLAGDWSEAPRDEAHGQRVLVRTGGRSWEVELARESVAVSPPQGSAASEVSGEPAATVLWLWGRGPLEQLSWRGDPADLALLRDRLRLATQ
ncbi:MAG: maleylpyruvate isomerase family mycothiol-dependent enzyme [Candidatus Dormibacteria bacterium]